MLAPLVMLVERRGLRAPGVEVEQGKRARHDGKARETRRVTARGWPFEVCARAWSAAVASR